MVLSYDKELYQKGLIMTEKNPDDSVRLEQSGTPKDVAGTEDATQERNEPEAEEQSASEVSAEIGRASWWVRV